MNDQRLMRSFRAAMDPPADPALARAQSSAGAFGAGDSGEHASSGAASPKRRRTFPSAGAEVNPQVWLKRVHSSTSTGARARGLGSRNESPPAGTRRVSMRVHRVYVGLAGLLFLGRMQISTAKSSNLSFVTHFSPPPVQRKKHILKLDANKCYRPFLARKTHEKS